MGAAMYNRTLERIHTRMNKHALQFVPGTNIGWCDGCECLLIYGRPANRGDFEMGRKPWWSPAFLYINHNDNDPELILKVFKYLDEIGWARGRKYHGALVNYIINKQATEAYMTAQYIEKLYGAKIFRAGGRRRLVRSRRLGCMR